MLFRSPGLNRHSERMKNMPNKPVLPTAHTPTNEYSLSSLRRQTGQPFGSQESGEQRATEEQDLSHVLRVMGNDHRTTSGGYAHGFNVRSK